MWPASTIFSKYIYLGAPEHSNLPIIHFKLLLYVYNNVLHYIKDRVSSPPTVALGKSKKGEYAELKSLIVSYLLN